MQDSVPSTPSSVALSAKLPIPKQPNKGISDAQKKALRVYASETHPRPTQRACAEWFSSQFKRHINRATVSKILSSKYQHLDTGFAGQNKRPSASRWPALDEALHIWQQRHEDAGFPMTGPLIQNKAVEYWRKLPQYKNLPTPFFSEGWLSRFKQRHSIRYHTSYGESASVPTSIHDEMDAVRVICDQYQPNDVYNMDETGLYWRRMPNGGLSSKGSPSYKKDKTRITLAVTTNATGSDRMPLWLIGTAKTPRALRNLNISALGCVWKWNRRAWMRGDIMQEWFRSFYKHIGTQRQVVLLLDNFSAHLSALEDTPPPSNIKVVFLPPNATSIYQPLDQGIIRNLKHHYRKKWMTWMINMIDRDIDPTERMSLYYTLHWITQVWRTGVREGTIWKCFIKSTVISPRTDEINAPGDQSEDLQLGDLYSQVSDRLPGAEVMELDEFLDPADENIDVEEPDLADIIVRLSEENGGGGGGAYDQDDGDKDEYIFGPPLDILSRVDAVKYMHKALEYAQHQEGITGRDLRDIEKIERLFSRLQVDGRQQRKVDDYFRPKVD